MDRCFEYCILRLMPDAVRGEVVNIGIVVFLNDRVDVRITKNMVKAQALVPNFSLEGIDGIADEIADVANGLPPAEAVSLLKDLGPLTVSQLGFFSANETTYDNKIEQIMRWMVNPPARQAFNEGRSRLHTEIRKQFKDFNLLGKSPDDIAEHKVIPGYTLPGESDMSIDFAMKNGLWRFTQVVDYRTTSKGAHNKIKEVSVKAVTLHQAPKALDVKSEEVKGYALVWVPPEFESIAAPHLRVMSDFTPNIMRYDRPEERERYWKLVAGWVENSRLLSNAN